jgi:hypothetical protein
VTCTTDLNSRQSHIEATLSTSTMVVPVIRVEQEFGEKSRNGGVCSETDLGTIHDGWGLERGPGALPGRRCQRICDFRYPIATG